MNESRPTGKPSRPLLLVLGVCVVAAAVLLLCAFTSARRLERITFWLTRSRDRGAVVFLGDSIAAQWHSLSAAFPGYKVANRGLDGDFTATVLARLERDVIPLSPSAVVLIIGTNDLNADGNPDAAVRNVIAILQRLRARFPHLPVVVCKVTPRGGAPEKFPRLILEFNAVLEKTLESDPDTVVFDTWTLFADAKGAPRLDEFPDLLHPDQAAYAKWAAALRPVLQKVLTRHVAMQRK